MKLPIIRNALAGLLGLILATPVHGAYNILFIAVDDLRPELNCYGANYMVTPHIDRLAASGRLFRNHYAAVPTCGASRYAMMTGKRPTALADTRNTAFNQLPETEGAAPESWVHLLKRNGWYTACIGKITHEPDGFRWNSTPELGGDDRGRVSAAAPNLPFSWDEIIFGPDRWGARVNPLFNYANGSGRTHRVSPAYEIGTNSEDNSYLDGQIAEAAVEKLQEFKQDGRQFVLAVGFFRPHLPFNAPKKYWDLYDPNKLPGPVPTDPPIGANPATLVQSSEPGGYNHAFYPGDPGDYLNAAYIKTLRRGYFACVSYVDAQVGKLLEALDREGLAKNTVVVFWSDHGWLLGDYGRLGKHLLLDRTVHSPLIVRVPGIKFPGQATDGLVETIDIYPTLAELCGLKPPATIGGSSLVPMLESPEAPGKEWAYSMKNDSTNSDSIRTERWRLIRVGQKYDLYDFRESAFETTNVAASNNAIVEDLANRKLQVQSPRKH